MNLGRKYLYSPKPQIEGRLREALPSMIYLTYFPSYSDKTLDTASLKKEATLAQSEGKGQELEMAGHMTSQSGNRERGMLALRLFSPFYPVWDFST